MVGHELQRSACDGPRYRNDDAREILQCIYASFTLLTTFLCSELNPSCLRDWMDAVLFRDEA